MFRTRYLDILATADHGDLYLANGHRHQPLHTSTPHHETQATKFALFPLYIADQHGKGLRTMRKAWLSCVRLPQAY